MLKRFAESIVITVISGLILTKIVNGELNLNKIKCKLKRLFED